MLVIYGASLSVGCWCWHVIECVLQLMRLFDQYYGRAGTSSGSGIAPSTRTVLSRNIYPREEHLLARLEALAQSSGEQLRY